MSHWKSALLYEQYKKEKQQKWWAPVNNKSIYGKVEGEAYFPPKIVKMGRIKMSAE